MRQDRTASTVIRTSDMHREHFNYILVEFVNTYDTIMRWMLAILEGISTLKLLVEV